jgi:hypothetical protein
MHWSYITSEKSFSLLIQGQIILEYIRHLLLPYNSVFDKIRCQQNFSRVLISTNRWQQISLKNSARLFCKCVRWKDIKSWFGNWWGSYLVFWHFFYSFVWRKTYYGAFNNYDFQFKFQSILKTDFFATGFWTQISYIKVFYNSRVCSAVCTVRH